MSHVANLIRKQSESGVADDIVSGLQPFVDIGMSRRSVVDQASLDYCNQVRALYQDEGCHTYTDAELAAGFLEYLQKSVREYNSDSNYESGGFPLVSEPDRLTVQQCVDLYLASRGQVVRIVELYDDGRPTRNDSLYIRMYGQGGRPNCSFDLSESNEELVRFYSAASDGSMEGFPFFLQLLRASAYTEHLFFDSRRAFLYWVSQKGLVSGSVVFPVRFLYQQYLIWKSACGVCVSDFSVETEEQLASALCYYGSIVPGKDVRMSDVILSMSSFSDSCSDSIDSMDIAGSAEELGPCVRLQLSRGYFFV